MIRNYALGRDMPGRMGRHAKIVKSGLPGEYHFIYLFIGFTYLFVSPKALRIYDLLFDIKIALRNRQGRYHSHSEDKNPEAPEGLCALLKYSNGK